MYYNIKIKSNGSEFSLESTNKEITQREMDIYFAQIFNASEDFKSNIKKVEINNANVKSINDFESYTKPIPTEIKKVQPKFEKTEEPNKTRTEIEIEIPKPINHEKTELKITSVSPEIKIEVQKEVEIKSAEIKTKPIEQIHLQNSPSPIIQNISLPSQTPVIKKTQDETKQTNDFQTKEDLAPINQNEFDNHQTTQADIESLLNKMLEVSLEPIETQAVENQIPINESSSDEMYVSEPFKEEIATSIPSQEKEYVYQAQTFFEDEDDKTQTPEDKNEIDELIAIAQNKLKELNINVNEKTTQAPTTPIENVDTTYDTINLDLSNSRFANHKDFSESLAQEKEKYISGNQETNNNYYDYDRQKHLDGIFSKSNNYEDDTQESQEENQETSVIETTTFDSPIMELPPINLMEVDLENKPTQEIKNETFASDFKLYLNNFICENQSEKFLICAYYIKNILKEENFTMKSINSKLFQATGMIANLEVLDDLISREYIRVIETQDFKKYCITPDGEGYFISKFQG